MDVVMQEDKKRKQMREAAQEKRDRKDYWLTRHLIVKVMAKKLADGKFYKKKGVVRKVHDRYVGEVKMVNSGTVIKLDQQQLETVIPAVGKAVRIVNGRGRGEVGELLELDLDKYTAKVKVTSGESKGAVLEAVEYEDICKFDEEACRAELS